MFPRNVGIYHETAWSHNPEQHSDHRRQNLKFYIIINYFTLDRLKSVYSSKFLAEEICEFFSIAAASVF
jgi:hypothetical protein